MAQVEGISVKQKVVYVCQIPKHAAEQQNNKLGGDAFISVLQLNEMLGGNWRVLGFELSPTGRLWDVYVLGTKSLHD